MDIRIPAVRPVSSNFSDSYTRLSGENSASLYTVITPVFAENLNIKALVDLGFRRLPDNRIYTDRVLTKDDWRTIDASITKFEPMRAAMVANLAPGQSADVIPLEVAEYLVDQYIKDQSVIAQVVSAARGGAVEQVDIDVVMQCIAEGDLNDTTAAAVSYAIISLVESGTVARNSKRFLATYNACLEISGEPAIQTLDSIFPPQQSGQLLKRAGDIVAIVDRGKPHRFALSRDWYEDDITVTVKKNLDLMVAGIPLQIDYDVPVSHVIKLGAVLESASNPPVDESGEQSEITTATAAPEEPEDSMQEVDEVRSIADVGIQSPLSTESGETEERSESPLPVESASGDDDIESSHQIDDSTVSSIGNVSDDYDFYTLFETIEWPERDELEAFRAQRHTFPLWLEQLASSMEETAEVSCTLHKLKQLEQVVRDALDRQKLVASGEVFCLRSRGRDGFQVVVGEKTFCVDEYGSLRDAVEAVVANISAKIAFRKKVSERMKSDDFKACVEFLGLSDYYNEPPHQLIDSTLHISFDATHQKRLSAYSVVIGGVFSSCGSVVVSKIGTEKYFAHLRIPAATIQGEDISSLPHLGNPDRWIVEDSAEKALTVLLDSIEASPLVGSNEHFIGYDRKQIEARASAPLLQVAGLALPFDGGRVWTKEDFGSLVVDELHHKLRIDKGWLESNWKERLSTALAQNGIVVFASSKRQTSYDICTVKELHEKYGGDRLYAADQLIAGIKGRRGFSRAKALVFDPLKIIDHELYDQVIQMANPPENRNVAVGSRAGARQDVGEVRGMARKNMSSLSAEEVKEHTGQLPYRYLKTAVNKNKLWPNVSPAKMREKGYDLPVAVLAKTYRSLFPSEPLDYSVEEDVDHFVSSICELREVFSDPKAKLDDVLNDLVGWHEEFCPVSLDPDSLAVEGFQSADFDRNAKRLWLTVLVRSRARDPAIYRFTQGKVSNRPAGALSSALALEADGSGWDKYLAENAVSSNRATRSSFSDLPHLEHLERTGPDRRANGSPTDERSLIHNFGFSGVEYGSWTNQSERELCMEFTYDSFADLADVMGVPPKALSMGGRIGLAYGSRGRGGRGAALAHFEPFNQAINLTRMKGAGSLCHEYFHAFANHFARLKGPLSLDVFEAISEQLDRSNEDLVVSGAVAGNVRVELYEAFIDLYRTMAFSPSDSSPDLVASEFQSRCRSIDKREKRKTSYWSAPSEMFARTMEVWVYDKLVEKGIYNNYLIRPDRFKGELFSDQYPTREEMAVLSPKIDKMMSMLQTRPVTITHPIGEEMALPVLYSRDDILGEDSYRVESSGELAATIAVNEVYKMLGGKAAVRITSDLFDHNKKPVAGSWDQVQRLISFSDSLLSKGVVDHESWHAAESLLLTKAELRMVRETFAPSSDAYVRLVTAMERDGKRHLVDQDFENPAEVAAYGFQYWSKGSLKLDEKNPVAAVFQKIKDVLRDILSISHQAGYRSTEKLFADFARGELASREMLESYPVCAKNPELPVLG